jgi:hypothetical protein
MNIAVVILLVAVAWTLLSVPLAFIVARFMRPDPVEPFSPSEAPGPDAIQINSHDGAMQHG